MRSWLGSAVVATAVALACATDALGALYGCDGVGAHVDGGLDDARLGADAGSSHGQLHPGVPQGAPRPRAPPPADRGGEALVSAAPIVLALLALLVSSRRR